MCDYICITIIVVSIPIWCDYKLSQTTYIICFHFVSIPIWCDYKHPCLQDLVALFCVSIPIWCDYKAAQRMARHGRKVVSIPIWCDYKKNWVTFSVYLNTFQFQYGAIIRIRVILSLGAKKSFNSNMVRL